MLSTCKLVGLSKRDMIYVEFKGTVIYLFGSSRVYFFVNEFNCVVLAVTGKTGQFFLTMLPNCSEILIKIQKNIKF